MKAANTNTPAITHEESELDRKRLELEEMKFNYAKTIDEKKLRSDRSAKLWTQFSIFIPLIILLTGYYLTSYGEQTKREQARREEIIKSQRQFVEKQLAELYYPIQLRLVKGHEFFDIWRKNQTGPNMRIAKRIEEAFILPNHEETIKIIDTHFDLIKNESEDDKTVYPLMDAMKAYEKHVALFKALKDTGDPRKPIELDVGFPKDFFALIDQRIADLENRRDQLLLSLTSVVNQKSPLLLDP